MSLSWFIVAVIAFVYCYYWYRRPKRHPPGPRGFPVLGCIPILGNHPERTILKWSKTYGPIMSVRIGTEDHVILNDYNVIIQGLVKQSTSFSGRPRNFFIDQITEGHGLIFADYGEKWKSQRKFGLMTLRGFGVGKRSMENRIIEEIAQLKDSIHSKNGKAFDISVLLKYAVSNNICSIALGRRFDYDDTQFQEAIQSLTETFSDPVANAVVSVLILAPWLRHLPFFSHFNRRFIKDYRSKLQLFQDIIKDHENTFDKEDLRDFIDAFINEKNIHAGSSFTNVQLIQYIRDLFEAGTGSTTSTLSWALLCCIHYPHTQSKLREEILKIIGSDGKISMSIKNELPYTNAFIQEVYRFRTLVPLSLPHKTNENTEIGGYYIPKGTTVLPNIWAVHNDPNLWEEPSKFNPERFLDEKGNYLSSNHVIPFSVGPRHCLGEQLARMEVFIFLVGMIQKFEFLPDPLTDQLPNIEGHATGHVFVNSPYNIVAKEI